MKSEERAKKAVKSAVLFKFQGFRKKGKKGIDKWGRIWYSNKAVGAGDRGAQEDEKTS